MNPFPRTRARLLRLRRFDRFVMFELNHCHRLTHRVRFDFTMFFESNPGFPSCEFLESHKPALADGLGTSSPTHYWSFRHMGKPMMTGEILKPSGPIR